MNEPAQLERVERGNAANADGVADAREGRKSWRDWLSSVFPGEPADTDDLLDILKHASERQLIDRDALNIIHGALDVANMRARDIMIPRSQVVTVNVESRVADFVPTIIESRHSRFPVVSEDMDDVKGILHAKDLLPLLLDNDWDRFDIKDYIRPSVLVPEAKRLNDLLQEFRETRNHMALVIDEYGKVSGVVTIEDVLEQIVGDIEDEYDVDDDSFIRQLDPNHYTVKGSTPIDYFNERFACDFAGDEFDTIGGIVTKKLGHLPKREEAVRLGRFLFRVLNADSRRIRLLHLTCA